MRCPHLCDDFGACLAPPRELKNLFRHILPRVESADASLLVLSFPDAVSATPPGPRLEIPAELVPLVTPHTFILLNKTDLLPTTSTSALTAFPQRGCWAVSLASQTGTTDFLAGLATALQDRCECRSPETFFFFFLFSCLRAWLGLTQTNFSFFFLQVWSPSRFGG